MSGVEAAELEGWRDAEQYLEPRYSLSYEADTEEIAAYQRGYRDGADEFHSWEISPEPLRCGVCGIPITCCELCTRCSIGNDPFFTSKYRVGPYG